MRFILRLISKYLIVNSGASTGLSNSHFHFFKNVFYKLGTQVLIDRRFPIQVGLELSRACNYSCPFCSREDAQQGSHLNFESAKKVIDEASSFGPTVFTSHMWGEPLLNPNWDKFYKYIRNKSRFHGISLTTNGYLLTEEVIKKLLKYSVDEVVVSLHTFDKIEYKHRVGKDIDLDIVYEKCLSLLKMRNKNKNRMKIVVKVFERNSKYKSNSYFLELEKLGAIIENDFYDNSGGSTPDWSEVKGTKDRYPCFHPWLTTTVNYKGEVSLCCVDNKMDLKIGDVTKLSLANMWQGKLTLKAREEHLNEEFSDFCKICKNCDTWKNKPNFFFKSQYKNRSID